MKHILLATDLSTTSIVVAKKARFLADKFKAKLSVIYVVEYLPITYGASEFALPFDTNLLEQFEQNAKQTLKFFGKDFKIAEVDQYVTTDTLGNSVAKLAEKTKADLIVVGSHGKHGVGLILGSGANSIVHNATCDVLAVRITENNS
jgi:universal stress protein A